MDEMMKSIFGNHILDNFDADEEAKKLREALAEDEDGEQ